MEKLFILIVLPILIISFMFSCLVWLFLSTKYKKNYKEDFDLWEKEIIQKSLYDYKRKTDLLGQKSTDNILTHNIDILIIKWEAVSDNKAIN